MIEAEGVGLKWSEVCGELCKNFNALRPIFGLDFEDLQSEEVLRLRLPYGAQIIENGEFCWDLLPDDYRDWESSYGEIRIPLGIVTQRTVELYEKLGVNRHSVPLYLLTAGEFFGLFQTLCADFDQSTLCATAGSTSIVVVPAIGTVEKLQKYVNARGLPKLKPKYHTHLKGQRKEGDHSRFLFGEFLGEVLRYSETEWRTEIIIFPRSVVDRLRQTGEANQAILAFALDQMRHSYERAQEAVQMLSNHRGGAHALALRMIHRGLRPGLTPVFCSEEDMDALPACDLHLLFHETLELASDEGANAGVGDSAAADGASDLKSKPTLLPNEGEFPILFRPSFRHERAVYFRNWPYAETGDGKATIPTIIADAAEVAEGAEGGATQRVAARQRKSFTELSAHNIRTYLDELRKQRSGALKRPIVIPVDKNQATASYFLRGGVIAVEPKVHRPRE